MPASLLNTEILHEVFSQKNANVVKHAAAHLAEHGPFAITSFSRHRVLRALKEKNATAQLDRFKAFCQKSLIFPVRDYVLDRAADLWVIGRRQGLTPNDTDVIMAAIALDAECELVTSNTPHFAWIPGLTLADWFQP